MTGTAPAAGPPPVPQGPAGRLVAALADRWAGLPRPDTPRVEIRRALRVPMPDGVSLAADRYRPIGAGPLPVVLIRTPYRRDNPMDRTLALALCRRGCAVLVQNVRGVFGSGGVFRPFVQERDDGLATVDWLRRQRWCDGRVAAAGASYGGYAGWAVGAYADPPLTGLGVAVGSARMPAALYPGGAVPLADPLSWAQFLVRQERAVLPGLLPAPVAAHRLRRAVRLLPLSTADAAAAGHNVRFFQDVLAGAGEATGPGCRDAARDRARDAAADRARDRADRETGARNRDAADHAIGDRAGDRGGDQARDRAGVRARGRAGDQASGGDHGPSVPALTSPSSMVSGWFDPFLPAQLADLRALLAAGRQTRITIGPWRHTSPGVLRAMLADQVELLTRGLPDGPPVRAYLQRAARWVTLPGWPPDRVGQTPLYLRPAGRLGARPAGESAPDRFRYDPADPTPSVGGPLLAGAGGPRDNRAVERRGDVLCYTSDPLPAALDVLGEPTARLYVLARPGHHDLFVRLCDVDRRGRSVNVTDGIVRLAPDGTAGPREVPVSLHPTGYRFRAGHRLRVQVAGGGFPRYARNHGTGEPPGRAVRTVPVRVAVHHDAAYPSQLSVPILAGELPS